MTSQEIRTLINEYYLDSGKDLLTGESSQSVYPNAIIMTRSQYKEALQSLFNLNESLDSITDEDLEHIKVLSLEGLKVILTDFIESPKVIRLTVK
jgi:hypothetical protein